MTSKDTIPGQLVQHWLGGRLVYPLPVRGHDDDRILGAVSSLRRIVIYIFIIIIA